METMKRSIIKKIQLLLLDAVGIGHVLEDYRESQRDVKEHIQTIVRLNSALQQREAQIEQMKFAHQREMSAKIREISEIKSIIGVFNKAKKK